MGILIRPCTADDWALLAQHHPDWAKRYEHVFAPQAEVYSGFVDGQMIGVAGFLFHAPRQAYCWAALLVEKWPRYPRALLQAIANQRDIVAEQHGLWRVEARADCAHWQACMFLEMLGFTCEGKLRASNEWGEDQFLYAFLTPDGIHQRSEMLDARYGTQRSLITQARFEYLVTALQRDTHGCSTDHCRRHRHRRRDHGNHLIHPGIERRSAQCPAELATGQSGCSSAGAVSGTSGTAE